MTKIISNKSILNYCFLWVILSFYSLLSTSAQSSPNFRNYSLEDGLSNNYVHAIHMDKEGWMWFGTFDGLNRFDGYEFKQYRSNSSDTTELHGRMVKTIFDAVMNITVKDFIKQVRLEKAAAYLQQGHLNVSEITFKVGFKDVSYFRKCFKNYFGSSPSEYQKKAKV